MKNILFLMKSMQGGGAEKVLLNILKNMDYQKYNIFRQFYVYFPSCTVKKLCDIIVTENAHRRQNPAMAACGHDVISR